MGLNQDSEINQPERGMSSVALASNFARRLVEGEARKNGQPLKAASRAVARRLRTSHGSIWALLFRPPKQISADLFAYLETAVDQHIRQEISALEDELASLHQASRKGRRLDPRTLAEIAEDLARLRAVMDGERE